MGKRRSTPETILAAAHPKRMGRDEMNLAEFPLATLADRAPRGCKTLVFEYPIGNPGQAQPRVRWLTISASDKYGLPAAIDDEVVLGLVQISKVAGFADRRVRFSRYQLIHLLGWRDEGRSYRRLEQSLKRWLGVTLYYENAWRDNVQRRWVDAHFHLLDELVLYRRPMPHGGVSAKSGDAAASSFTWNEMVFRSFQAGFLKKLDLDFYRRLKLAAARRMYRFLDKKFHFKRTWRFKLPVFACEHIGVSRRYDAAQLKRRLNPAIAELEQAGYLLPLPPSERFHRLRRGHWEVVFVRAPTPPQQRRREQKVSDLEERLVERGVTASMAVQLVRQHAADLIEGKIAVYDALRRTNDRRMSRNPAGFLVQSIREDYAPPAGVLPEARRVSFGPAPVGKCARSTPLRRKRFSPPSLEDMEHKVDEYLAELSPEGRSKLEATAVACAKGVAADGLQRAVDSNRDELVSQYRQILLRQYLLRLLTC